LLLKRITSIEFESVLFTVHMLGGKFWSMAKLELGTRIYGPMNIIGIISKLGGGRCFWGS